MYRQVYFHARDTFPKNIAQINTELPFKILYFLGVMGPHPILWTYRPAEYIVMYCTYSIHTILYNIFVSNAMKLSETHIHSLWYHSFRYDCGRLAT